MKRPFISPAPTGEIALVCCSPENFHTIKDLDTTSNPSSNHKDLNIKEESLNVFNPQAFQSAIDCGFNVLMYPGSDLQAKWKNYTSMALNFCQRNGVKLIVNSPILNIRQTPLTKEYKKNWPKEFVEEFVNHKALGGWQLKDEPLYSAWHNVQDSEYVYDNYQTICGLDNNHIVFMNLAADTKDKWIGNQSYENYLTEFDNKFHPALWTFDLYPVHYKGKTNEIVTDTTSFYTFLNIFSNKSKETNRPFWSYCLCLAHDKGERNYPYATEGMLRFEAFSALAFGAQGLVFWRYKQEYTVAETTDLEKHPSGKIFFSSNEMGPLDLFGTKTPIWDNLKQVISEIKGKNDYFYQCKCVDHIIANGSGSTTELTGYGNLAMLKAHTKGVLITRIETPDQNSKDQYGNPIIHKYMVVVNSDPLASQDFELLYQSSSSTSDNNNIVGTTPGIDTGLHPFKDTDDGNYDGSSEWTRHTLIPGGCYIWPIV